MFGGHHFGWQSAQCGCPDPPKSSKPLYMIMEDPGIVYNNVLHVNAQCVPTLFQEQKITLIDEIDFVSKSGSMVKCW